MVPKQNGSCIIQEPFIKVFIIIVHLDLFLVDFINEALIMLLQILLQKILHFLI